MTDTPHTVGCVGIAVVDYIYRVRRLPGADSKVRTPNYIASGGGMAAGAAVAAARLGATARWYGRLGNDTTGDEILNHLAAERVDVSAAQRVEGVTSPHSIVLVDSEGERAIVACGTETLPDDCTWLPLRQLEQCDVVLADIRWIPGAVSAFRAARGARIPCVLDGDSTTNTNATEAVRWASHAIFSRQGLSDIYGVTCIQSGLQAAHEHAPFVAVTLGEDGVAWLDDGGTLRQLRPPPVTALETLGAGDVFHGAFASALARQLSESEALRYACAAAALKCAGTGGWDSFPEQRQVDELLANWHSER